MNFPLQSAPGFCFVQQETIICVNIALIIDTIAVTNHRYIKSMT